MPTLDLYINGKRVAEWEKSSSTLVYDDEWIQKEYAFPISHSLPITQKEHSGEHVQYYFTNLLPDDGEAREKIQNQSDAPSTDPFDLLKATGDDVAGGIQFIDPDDPVPEEPFRIHAKGTEEPRKKKLNDQEIKDQLNDLDENPLGITEDGRFRLSLAGQQNKTGFLKYQNEWYLPQGPVPTTHIFKPEIDMKGDSISNEYFCMKLADALELPVPNVEIAEFNGKRCLIIERFDRHWEGQNLYRLHNEDFCQALQFGPGQRYENKNGPSLEDCAELLRQSDQPKKDHRTFFRAQVFNWLIGNIDGHAKNFSIRWRANRSFVMAPLYDLVSIEPEIEAHKRSRYGGFNAAGRVPDDEELPLFAFAFKIGKKNVERLADITPENFIEEADNFLLSEKQAINILSEFSNSIEGAIQSVDTNSPHKLDSSTLLTIKEGIKTRKEKIDGFLEKHDL